MRIEINSFKNSLGGGREEHERYTPMLANAISTTLKLETITEVLMYNMAGTTHSHKVGLKEKKMIIFNNATSHEYNEKYQVEEGIVINGINYRDYKKFMYPTNSGEVLMSDNDVAIAEWFPEDFQLNILFDMFPSYSSEYVVVFEEILREIQLKLDTLDDKYCWNKTRDQKYLIETIKQQMSVDVKNKIEQKKYDIQRHEENIVGFKNKIKTESDNLIAAMRSLNVEDTDMNDLIKKLQSDLHLIVNNEFIEDVLIKNNKFIIKTIPLFITSDEDRIYKAGRFDIDINISNSDIRFSSDVTHKSFWSANDPHPHVSGRSGTPCWGNVSSTIAELCSQKELYALVLFCLDYLQSANTGDPAGINIRKWQEIDENGDDVERETYSCPGCGADMEEDDEYYEVYEDYWEEDDEFSEQLQVCEECYGNNYSYYESIDTAVANYHERDYDCDEPDCDEQYEEEEE